MARANDGTTQIERGMPVIAGDGREVGELDDMDESTLEVGAHRIPLEAVERITPEGIFLHRDATWPDLTAVAPSAGAARAGGGRADATAGNERNKTVRVPVAEEHLRVEKRPTEGEVEVRKSVEEADEVVGVSLERGEVEVRRVPIGRQIDAPVGQRMEGEWLIVPVLEEVLVVEKRLVLKEEIRIRTTQAERKEEVRERVRRERVDVVPVGTTRVRIVEAAATPAEPAAAEPAAAEPAAAEPAAAEPAKAQRGNAERRPRRAGAGSERGRR